MKKEEFLAMSLPYGLKAIYTPCDRPDYIVEFGPSRYIMLVNKEYDYKPIIRPLSDLTKQIEHNGEEFVPIQEIFNHTLCYAEMQNGLYESFVVFGITQKPFWMVEKLIEWHFDIAGLIENGEAIDINRLPENPYK